MDIKMIISPNYRLIVNSFNYAVVNVRSVQLIRDRGVQLDLIHEALKLCTMTESTN